MAFIKHIGKHSDRKVAIIFRQIPGDDHMCLVIYPDLLATHIHDSIMKVLESPAGQASDDLADVLHRNLLPDGRNMLEVLHIERLMKRVNTEQILVTPNAASNIKLSELNKILNEMKIGEGAVRKMAEIDANAGLVDAKTKRNAEAQFKSEQMTKAANGYLAAPDTGALDDKALAANMLAQAQRMHNEATSMINEAARMKKDAERMFPSVIASTKPAKTAVVKTKVTDTPAETTAVAAKPRGRKPKVAVAHAAQ